MIKKIAVLTSGGDSPGMNNAVRTIVKYTKVVGIEPFVVYEGFKGLYEGNIKSAKNLDVDQYVAKGGSFIFSSRFPNFKKLEVRQKAKEELSKLGIDALVVIGGDGSYIGAQKLHEIGVKTMCLPGTIDNDIASSDFTIGYDTALNTIVENVSKVRDTMNSHNRAAIIEVMGRGCADLAIFAAMATGANLVISKENVLKPNEISDIVKDQIITKGKRSAIIIVSELIYEDIHKLAKEVEAASGIVTRGMAFEHIQRGGVPTANERNIATRMALRSIELLVEGKSGMAIGIVNGHTHATPIVEALSMPRDSRISVITKINKINQI